jgi:hypothetical protein
MSLGFVKVLAALLSQSLHQLNFLFFTLGSFLRGVGFTYALNYTASVRSSVIVAHARVHFTSTGWSSMSLIIRCFRLFMIIIIFFRVDLIFIMILRVCV